jgi:hypothetical protein
MNQVRKVPLDKNCNVLKIPNQIDPTTHPIRIQVKKYLCEWQKKKKKKK